MKKGKTLDPLSVLNYQKKCGCDIGIAFDYPIPPTISEGEKKRRIRETIKSANLALSHHDKSFKLFAAIHGSNEEEILSCKKRLDDGFDGYGIGSLVPKKRHYEHLVDLIYSTRNSTKIPSTALASQGFPPFLHCHIWVSTPLIRGPMSSPRLSKSISTQRNSIA